MSEWNEDMSAAPQGELCWIYVPAFEEVAGDVVAATKNAITWEFDGFSVNEGELPDDDGFDDDFAMIGPLAWMPCGTPKAPVHLEHKALKDPA